MRFVKQSVIRASQERVFAFHELPEALALLIPPWEKAKIIQAAKISEIGSQAVVETRIFGPIAAKWVARHTLYDPPHVFEDIQIKGPFRSWRHRHVVEPDEQGAILRDEIDYEPRFGFVGRLLAPLLIEKRLRKLFDYRHEAVHRWCETSSSEFKL